MKRQNLETLNNRLEPMNRSLEKQGRGYVLKGAVVDVNIRNLSEATEVVSLIEARMNGTAQPPYPDVPV